VTVAETPHEESDEVAAPSPQAAVGTPVWVWVVYGLGVLAGTVFAVSLLFLLFAYAATGSGGFGVHVSEAAFVVWLVLAVAAAVTFVWRRFGSSR
jgi:hypothetical protein